MSKTFPKMPIKEMTGEEFDALPVREKDRIFQEIEQKGPAQLLAESRPLSKAERARDRRIRANMGRPKIGEGVSVISLSMEQGLLRTVDAFAHAHNLKRSELVSQALRAFTGGSDKSMKIRSNGVRTRTTAKAGRAKRRLAAG